MLALLLIWDQEHLIEARNGQQDGENEDRDACSSGSEERTMCTVVVCGSGHRTWDAGSEGAGIVFDSTCATPLSLILM